ncbi:MAG TPA: hypothetical protein VGP72_10435 [Planctomycetota bacterium]|jgi:hypothetical protein
MRYEVSEKFEAMPVPASDWSGYANQNNNFEIQGFSATLAAAERSYFGGVQLQPFGFSGAQAILAPNTQSGTSWYPYTWQSDTETCFAAVVKTGSDLSGGIFWAGLKQSNTAITGVDDHAAFFRYCNTTDATWQFIQSVNGVDYVYTSDEPVLPDTLYRLAINIDKQNVPHVEINDKPLAVSSGPHLPMAAGISLQPLFGVSPDDATSPTMQVWSISMSKVLA